MRVIVQWMFWKTVYFMRRRPTTIEAVCVRAFRCRSPWWKFRPVVYHNDDGRMWHVYFTDERSYTDTRRRLSVQCHIGEESGDIVGFNVFDEALKSAKPTDG